LASKTTARCSTSVLTASGNLLEVVSVVREDGSDIVIHAMSMRAKYEPFLGGEGDSDA
jgi:hypothetical protein